MSYRSRVDRGLIPQEVVDIIEAAKACVANNHPPELQYDRERWDWLVQTVEALQAVEGE